MSYTPIELDKIRNFRYGMKAMSLIEKKLKRPVGKLDLENLTMEDTATMMWAGLVHEDKGLTPYKVMDLVDDFSDIATVTEAMAEALSESIGKSKTDTEEIAREGEVQEKNI